AAGAPRSAEARDAARDRRGPPRADPRRGARGRGARGAPPARGERARAATPRSAARAPVPRGVRARRDRRDHGAVAGERLGAPLTPASRARPIAAEGGWVMTDELQQLWQSAPPDKEKIDMEALKRRGSKLRTTVRARNALESAAAAVALWLLGA